MSKPSSLLAGLALGALLGATPLLGWLLTWLAVSVVLALLAGTSFVLARDGPRAGPRLLAGSARALVAARPCDVGALGLLDVQVVRARRAWLVALALLGACISAFGALAWCARVCARVLARCAPAWRATRVAARAARRVASSRVPAVS